MIQLLNRPKALSRRFVSWRLDTPNLLNIGLKRVRRLGEGVW